MKRSFAFVLILLCSTLAYGAQGADWLKFDSSLGDFSVLMPCEPKETKDSKNSEFGPYTSYIYTCNSAAGEVYLAGWVDYDPKFTFDPQKELEANRDNFIKGLKATLGTSENFSYRGYKSLEFDGATEGAAFKSRVFIVGKRPYMLVVAYLKGQELPQNVNKFFSSFNPGRSTTANVKG